MQASGSGWQRGVGRGWTWGRLLRSLLVRGEAAAFSPAPGQNRKVSCPSEGKQGEIATRPVEHGRLLLEE